MLILQGISSFTYRARRPFFPNKLADALDAMIDKVAPFDKSIVLRAKGFVWLGSFYSVQGDFSLAGSHYTLMPGNPWWAEIDKEHWPQGLEDALVPPLWQEPFGDRQQEIVIIGQSLDKDSIIRALDDCLLTEDDLRKGKDVWIQLCADAGDPYYENWYHAIESIANAPKIGHSHDHCHDHCHD
jgi:G3E family GTPase